MKQINENEIIFEDGEDVILSPENEWIEITTFQDAYENIKRFVRGFENERYGVNEFSRWLGPIQPPGLLEVE